MDKAIGPSARAVRLLLITPALACVILWAVRGIEPRPWTVIRFFGLDVRSMLTWREFWFNGRWHHPGRWHLHKSYAHIADSWQASLAVGLALFAGGVVALWIDRLIMRLHRSPTLPMP